YQLTPEEAIVWTRHMMQLWLLLEATYNHESREIAETYVRVLLQAEDNRVYVENARFSSEFDTLVRGVLSEIADS
ncbi:MAG: hypothetical protein R3348_04560, partial [Xanthomonadales bacterium]|nr:hypothetical protein [Xanthomonadales bacterium]